MDNHVSIVFKYEFPRDFWSMLNVLYELTAFVFDKNIARGLRRWADGANGIPCYNSKFIAFTTS